jgi:hypothetical protein
MHESVFGFDKKRASLLTQAWGFFKLFLVASGSVARWFQYGSTVRESSTENGKCVAPLSYFYIVLLL